MQNFPKNFRFHCHRAKEKRKLSHQEGGDKEAWGRGDRSKQWDKKELEHAPWGDEEGTWVAKELGMEK